MGEKAEAAARGLRATLAIAALAVVCLLASTGPSNWAFSEPAAPKDS